MRGVGRYASAGRWRDLASRPSSRSPRLALRLVRFPRIGLRAECVRRFCQLILLCHSLAAGRIVFLFVSSLVSLARLVWASRVYSLRLAHLSVSSRRFVSISAIRFASRVLVSLCGPSPSSRAIRLVRSSRQAVRVLSFRLGGSSRRLVWRGVSSVIRLSFRSLSVLVSSHSLPVHGHGDGGSSCPLSRGGVALAEWSCRSTIRETHRFCQLDFLPSG